MVPTIYTCREGEAHVTEWSSNERSPGGIEEEDPSQRESDTGSGLELLMDTGEMELDGDLSDSEGETWPTDESNSSGNESGQFEHGEDGEDCEEMSSDDDDEVDDITENVESDEDTDDE